MTIYNVDLGDFARYLNKRAQLKSLCDKWDKLIVNVGNPDTVGTIEGVNDVINAIVSGYIYRKHIAWKVDNDSTYFEFCKYAIEGAIEYLKILFAVRSKNLTDVELDRLQITLMYYSDVVYLKSNGYKRD